MISRLRCVEPHAKLADDHISTIRYSGLQNGRTMFVLSSRFSRTRQSSHVLLGYQTPKHRPGRCRRFSEDISPSELRLGLGQGRWANEGEWAAGLKLQNIADHLRKAQTTRLTRLWDHFTHTSLQLGGFVQESSALSSFTRFILWSRSVPRLLSAEADQITFLQADGPEVLEWLWASEGHAVVLAKWDKCVFFLFPWISGCCFVCDLFALFRRGWCLFVLAFLGLRSSLATLSFLKDSTNSNMEESSVHWTSPSETLKLLDWLRPVP